MTTPNTFTLLILLLFLNQQRATNAFNSENLENVMHVMADHMEHEIPISAKHSRQIEKEFKKLGKYVESEVRGGSGGPSQTISMKSGMSIKFEFPQRKHRRSPKKG